MKIERCLRQQEPLELLGICDRRITAAKGVDTRRKRRIRTRLVTEPRTLGEHIHHKRVSAGLTQKELAAQWGIWRATLYGWEAGHYEPEGGKRTAVIGWLGFDPSASA